MKKMDSKKPRLFSRIPFQADVQLHFDVAQEIQTARLLDISLKGALVETLKPMDNAFSGSNCSMVLVLVKGGESITMEGKVVHQDGQLMGIESQYIDVDSMINLRRLVELNSGDKKQMDRELGEMLKRAVAGAKSKM
jgi:hypothetical protein